MERLQAWITRFVQGLLILLTGTMTVVVLLEVILRYLFKTGFPWSEELARYLLIALTFIGASEALRRGRHVSVSIFVRAMPDRIQVPLRIAIEICMMIFLLLFAYSGYLLLQRFHFQVAPALRISMAWPHGALFLGALLMIFQLLLLMLKGPKASTSKSESLREEV